MREMTQKGLSRYVLTLLIYLVAALTAGFLKVSLTTGILSPDIIQSARLSAYVGLTLSAVVSVIIILLISAICYFLIDLFASGIDAQVLVSGLRWAVVVFTAFEVLRIPLVYIYLKNELKHIDGTADVIAQLKRTAWYFYDSMLTYSMLVTATIVFGVELSSGTKNKHPVQVLIVSLILLLGFYLSTIDVFKMG
ncbi:MAG: hypothetical protein V6Z82_05365 [Flavobacteriales bacterium]